MKKIIWTLNVKGNYSPDIINLTYPLIKKYAHKIGADFNVITERKWPEFPVVYEKLQIYELGRGNDWNIFIDSDALIHPDFWDVTEMVPRDTVFHVGQDFAPNRWTYDRFFRRDGRNIGSCNWFAAASDWCIDLWTPLDVPPDPLTLDEALLRIHPIASELASRRYIRGEKNQIMPDDKGLPHTVAKPIITPEHLIDDYTLSRNIAKYGLQFINLQSIKQRTGDQGDYFWHLYQISIEEKIEGIKKCLVEWGIGL